MSAKDQPGPLSGVRVIEMASLGPGPYCAMLLSDFGADILRIDRHDAGPSPHPAIERGRRSVALDLKTEAGVAACLQLIARADILLEGYRPGVMERLGLGPDVALARNPKLVYGRMTGWGREGPYAQMAGHDPNYIALTGALYAIGPKERPMVPLNLVGDYGGGGMFLAFGVLAALTHAKKTGEGQVVDAAIVDGTASLMTALYGSFAAGTFSGERDTNPHFNHVYRCADGEFIVFCAFEPQFYTEFLRKAGVADDPDFDVQFDQARWPRLKEKLAAVFARKTRAQWCAVFEGSDACFAPVLSMAEAPQHPQNAARNVFVECDGMTVPAPAPRLSKTPGAIKGPPPRPGEHDEPALTDWGFSRSDIESLRAAGALKKA